MKLTLKKASALQRLVLETANKIDFTTSVSLSSFSNENIDEYVEKSFDGGVKNLNDSIILYQKLMEIGYDLRQKISEANAAADTSGVSINSLITLRARYEAEEKRFIRILSDLEMNASTDNSKEIVIGKLMADKARRLVAPTTERYRSDDTQSLSIVTNATLATFKAHLAYYRHEKSDTSDFIAGRNLNTIITISDETAEILRTQMLIT